MMRFTPPPEPANFDREVRQKGRAWLAKHTDRSVRPTDLWSAFKSVLADGFGNLCAYTAMYEPVGTVDHYLSCKHRRERAYEWANYRYAAGWINSSKQAVDQQVLDPFAVDDAWFEILLPDLQLVLTSAVPKRHRTRAAFTLERLHLRDDERVLRQRRAWYELFQTGDLSLRGLTRNAPLIARAVRTQRVLDHLGSHDGIDEAEVAALCELAAAEVGPFLAILVKQKKVLRIRQKGGVRFTRG
jgi:hypothetical protein